MTVAAHLRDTGDAADTEAIRAFLTPMIAGDIDGIAQLEGGRNNRVYLVHWRGGRVVVKRYHNDGIHEHDRLAAEFAFIRFMNKHGVTETPKAIACDQTRHMAAYDFIEGAPLQPGEVGAQECDAAAAFIQSLNVYRDTAAAQALRPAAEACFSLNNHLSLLGGRIARLEPIEPHEKVDRDAVAFVRKLRTAWRRIESNVRRRARHSGIDPAAALAPDDRCLSPSDFGFHNALRRADGTLVFIDFEYAGWDDPAKLVGDFFCQPAVPAPAARYESFVDAIVRLFDRPDFHRARIEWLRAVYQIKWCCIALNEFLPGDAQRRRFAGTFESAAESKARQLALAEEMLAAIEID